MSINLTSIKSALVSTVLMGILAVSVYIIQLGDVFKIDSHALINVAVMAALTGVVSILKTALTNSEGKFVGTVQVK